MAVRFIDRDRLGVLTKIGRGGQGVVYQAPSASTPFAEAMVYKEYKTTSGSGTVDYGALAAMPALVEESLTVAQAKRLISLAAWPCALVQHDSTPTGFVMPTIPAPFFAELTTAKGTSTTIAEMQHLLNHESVLAARGIAVDDVQRYQLLRETAIALAFLHQHGVVVGDISPKNLLYALGPSPSVYFIDCDAMRINGVSALPQLETPGWQVPAGEDLATIASDVYKLGLLALRLLAGDQSTIDPQMVPAATPTMLRQLITDTLTNLPERRPLPQAWSSILAGAIEQAQFQQRIAASDPVGAPLAAPVIPVVHSRPSPTAPTPAPPGPHATTSAELCIGNLVRILVPGDDRDGDTGRIVELFAYDPGVIVRFSDDPDPYAFHRNEVECVASSTSPWRLINKALKPGLLVRIRVPGDDRDGHVGRIVNLFADEPGVIVRFTDEPGPYAFRRREVEAVSPTKTRWIGRR